MALLDSDDDGEAQLGGRLTYGRPQTIHDLNGGSGSRSRSLIPEDEDHTHASGSAQGGVAVPLDSGGTKAPSSSPPAALHRGASWAGFLRRAASGSAMAAEGSAEAVAPGLDGSETSGSRGARFVSQSFAAAPSAGSRPPSDGESMMIPRDRFGADGDGSGADDRGPRRKTAGVVAAVGSSELSSWTEWRALAWLRGQIEARWDPLVMKERGDRSRVS